jgi:ribosomal protein S19E (S16A)
MDDISFYTSSPHPFLPAADVFELDPDTEIRKPSILDRLHLALSGVRGTSAVHAGGRAPLASTQDGGMHSKQTDADRAIFKNVLQQLEKTQPVAQRLAILHELSELVTR